MGIREKHIVVVKSGDNLYKIITHAYGSCNGAILGTVLQENPEIQNPDHILVDQVIKLPGKNEPQRHKGR